MSTLISLGRASVTTKNTAPQGFDDPRQVAVKSCLSGGQPIDCLYIDEFETSFAGDVDLCDPGSPCT